MKNCNSCGKCCIKYSNGGLTASDEDISLWESSRHDILPYVKSGKIWIDPKTNQQLAICPWLIKEPNASSYKCSIYFDRPEDCRVYPMTLNDMIKDDCEMLEAKDLKNLKQAQIDLDELIAISSDY